MNNTRQKLEEAKYFLNQLQLFVNNPKKFYFNLSAFLSAARSTTLFMQCEFKKFKEFSDWYEKKQKKMIDDKDFLFFNNLRVETIHKRIVRPHKRIEVGISGDISFIGNLEIKVFKNNKVISKKTVESEKIKLPPEKEVTVKYFWYSEERPDEDFLELCRVYVKKLEKLVEECEKNFIRSRM